MKKLCILLTAVLVPLTFSACDSTNPGEDGGFPITKQQPDQRRVDTGGGTVGMIPFQGQSAGKVSTQAAALELQEVAFVAKPEGGDPNTGAASSSLADDLLTIVYNTAGNRRDGSITTIDVSDPSNPVLVADYNQTGNIEFADVVIVDGKANVVGQKSSGAFFANVEDEVMLDLPSSTAIGVDAFEGKIAAVTGSEGSLTFIDSASYDTTRIVEGETGAFLGIDFDETGIAVTDAQGIVRLFNDDGELLTTTFVLPGPLRTNERAEIDREVFGNNSYYGVGAHSNGGIILDVAGNTVLTVEGFGLGVDLDEMGVAFSLADLERRVEGKVVLGIGDPVAGYTLYELTGLPYANSVQFDEGYLYVSTHEGTHILRLEEEEE